MRQVFPMNPDFLDPERGPFIKTWTGNPFYFFDPKTSEIHLEDIAHSLSRQCRFNGHCEEFYSVAEHCIEVSNIILRNTGDSTKALVGLMHDAAEAYIGDVVSPLKVMLLGYLRVEEQIEKCVAEAFDIPYPFPPEVKEADKEMLAREFATLVPFADEGSVTHVPLTPNLAKKEFLSRYWELERARR